MSRVEFLAAGEHDAHVVEDTLRGVEHGKPRRERLDGEARLDQLQGADLVGELRTVMGGAGRADIGAAAEPPRHQTGLLELIERPAHRAPRGVEGDGELAFRREPIALPVGAGLDGAAKMSRNGADAAASLGKAMKAEIPFDGAALIAHGDCLLAEIGPTLGPTFNKLVYIGPGPCRNIGATSTAKILFPPTPIVVAV